MEEAPEKVKESYNHILHMPMEWMNEWISSLVRCSEN